MSGLPSYDTARPWLKDKITFPPFLAFKGFSMSGSFNPSYPPPLYFQKALICWEYKDFISFIFQAFGGG